MLWKPYREKLRKLIDNFHSFIVKFKIKAISIFLKQGIRCTEHGRLGCDFSNYFYNPRDFLVKLNIEQNVI